MCDFCWGGYRRHSRGAAARPSGPPLPPDPPVPSAPVPSAPSTRVGHGVLLCWRAPSLPRVRYKILPARLLGGDNGTKLSLHVEKAPNRAILGEQGEFCTAHAVGRGVRGEFCPAHAVRGGVLGEFCTGSWAVRLVLGEICFVVAPSVCAVAGFPPPTGAPSWPSAPAARSTLVAVGVLRHAKPSGGVSPACRTLAWRNSPRLVAARSRLEGVWPPQCSPIG